jgi:hypothetical protein
MYGNGNARLIAGVASHTESIMLDTDKPVIVKKSITDKRADLKHYAGQRGRVMHHGVSSEYVMVFWRGLSCSSMWAVSDLKNVVGKEGVTE